MLIPAVTSPDLCGFEVDHGVVRPLSMSKTQEEGKLKRSDGSTRPGKVTTRRIASAQFHETCTRRDCP